MSRYSSDGISPVAVIVVILLIIGTVVGGGFACASCTTIEPGHVGVSIKKCGGGKVEDKPIPVGYYFRSVFCEEVASYPTNLQTLILTKSPHEGGSCDQRDGSCDESITVTSSEGLPINVDISMSFTIDPAKVPAIYTKYRQNIDDIAHNYMRQTIREGMQMTFARYTAEQLYSDKKEIVRAESQKFLTDKLGPEGIMIQQFTLNEIRVPEQVTAAINGKVAMIQDAQKAEQEVRKTQALAAQAKAKAEGDAQAVITKAEGDAKATKTRADAEYYYNTTVAKSLTPEYIRYVQTQRWNGALPQVQGGGATPFIQMTPR